MKLAFYRGAKQFVEEMILLRTGPGAEYCHVELLFADGTTFSSDLASGGTRFTDGASLRLHPERWTTVELGPMDEAALRAWCSTRLGEKYGMVGCMCFLLDLPDVQAGHPFCSQVCVEALQETQHIFGFLKPTATSPQELAFAAFARQEALATRAA